MNRHAVMCGLAGLVIVFAGGCSTSKKVWTVLKDPGVQVGELRDQPSRVALSLVAAADMNPNLYQPVEADARADTPYSVNLSGTDLADLARQLQATLQQVEKELDAPMAAPLQVEAVESAGEASVAGFIDAPVKETIEAGDGIARQVGEYARQQGENIPAEHSATAGNASPVELKVIQLKDDGRFLSADYDQLIASPEKALGKTYLEHDEFVVKPGEYKFVRFFAVKPDTRYIAVVASYHDTDEMTWKAIQRIEPNGGVYPLLVELGMHGVTIKNED